MAKSNATTVEEYLAELPEDRLQIVAAVRKLILEHLPTGYQESMNWGMISYEVPLGRYANTYNRQPLQYIGLAAQKNSYTIYLMSVYGEGEARLKDEFAKVGKKLDMRKSCVHFRRLEDLPLSVIADVVQRTPVDEFIARYEARRGKKS